MGKFHLIYNFGCPKNRLFGALVLGLGPHPFQNIYSFQGTIPPNWRKISYPSQCCLFKYLSDLSSRVEFFATWISNGRPDSFWLGGFFFPQSFLTAILQNYARKNGITVDQVSIARFIKKDFILKINVLKDNVH